MITVFKKKRKKNQSGMVVVETVIGFTAFMLVFIGMANFMNIYMVHNRIQFAINSAAHEIACYGYFYELFGVRAADAKIGSDWDDDAKNFDEGFVAVVDSFNKMSNAVVGTKETVDQAMSTIEQVENFEMVTDINSLQSQISGLYDSANNTYEKVNETVGEYQEAGDSLSKTSQKIIELVKDPKGMLAGLVGLGLDKGRSMLKGVVGTLLAETLTKKYLKNGDASADDYLNAYNIVGGYEGLDFSKSSVFAEETENGRMVDIVVEYDVDIGFLGYILPKSKRSIHMVQRASVAAWLGGDDNHVSDYIE